jgi:hypothetical protein
MPSVSRRDPSRSENKLLNVCIIHVALVLHISCIVLYLSTYNLRLTYSSFGNNSSCNSNNSSDSRL